MVNTKFILNRTKSNHAFTLIEMVVAIGITAIVIVSIIVIFVNSIVLNRDAKEKHIASKICQNKIEELRNTDYATVAAITTQTISVSELKNGSMTLTVSNTYTTSDIREVTVSLSWTGSKGQTKNINETTLIAKHGL